MYSGQPTPSVVEVVPASIGSLAFQMPITSDSAPAEFRERSCSQAHSDSEASRTTKPASNASEHGAAKVDLEVHSMPKKASKLDESAEIQRFNITADINPLNEVEKQQEKLSIIKAHLPFGRLFFLGFLAGWWLALAALLCITLSGGIPPAIRASWPMLPKIVTGFIFPCGIFFISLFGGELFTGNAMCMLIGLMARRITVKELLYNWIVVLVSNFTGAVSTVYFFGYQTQLFIDEPWNSYITGIAVTKINLAPQVAFLRAVTANALVCTCLLLGLSARDMIGKLAAMWFPIMVFAATGFEHAIANMAYIPLGLMYGAEADYKKWLYQNLIIAILGNIVGGGFIVGGAGYFLYDWTKLLNSVEEQQAALAQPQPTQEQPGKPTCSESTPARASTRRTVCVVDKANATRTFRIFDSDGDGAIDGREILCALQSLGFGYPKSLIVAMVRAQSASDGGGAAVDEAGFAALVQRIQDLEELGLKECV